MLYNYSVNGIIHSTAMVVRYILKRTRRMDSLSESTYIKENIFMRKARKIKLRKCSPTKLYLFSNRETLRSALHPKTRSNRDCNTTNRAYYKIDTQAPFEQIHVCL